MDRFREKLVSTLRELADQDDDEFMLRLIQLVGHRYKETYGEETPQSLLDTGIDWCAEMREAAFFFEVIRYMELLFREDRVPSILKPLWRTLPDSTLIFNDDSEVLTQCDVDLLLDQISM